MGQSIPDDYRECPLVPYHSSVSRGHVGDITAIDKVVALLATVRLIANYDVTVSKDSRAGFKNHSVPNCCLKAREIDLPMLHKAVRAKMELAVPNKDRPDVEPKGEVAGAVNENRRRRLRRRVCATTPRKEELVKAPIRHTQTSTLARESEREGRRRDGERTERLRYPSPLRQLAIKKVYFTAVNDKLIGTNGPLRIHKNSPYLS
ncbi:uncharacterized protein B0T15DRAFT_510469 [Chaetomium strumarium]|uniref:Uncharacterized protein n=1 Tax=Chaetomium strumarium TaxID=1170767 RepID=A0AAJ0GVZ4_9PEZI|nr:hypothetical protein B0T15DRAFT_510469 [Chaetomium strumarium]